MARFSSIDKLPEELRELIAKLRNDDHKTLDEIMSKLSELRGGNVGVSRSALGRHVKELDAVASVMRDSREMANDIMGKLGDKGDSQLARMVSQMLQTLIFKMNVAALNGDADNMPEAKDIRSLSDALYRLVSAEKVDADRVLKVRQETAKAALSAADAELKSEGGAGLTKGTQTKIMKLLGING